MTIAAFLAGLTLAAHAQTASAASEVRIARQYGIAYLPMTIMERDKLVEKHARAAGLEGVTVKWSTFAGANVMNDAQIQYTIMPRRVEKFVTFMHETGTLKTVPASWQEMFFPEVFTLGAP